MAAWLAAFSHRRRRNPGSARPNPRPVPAPSSTSWTLSIATTRGVPRVRRPARAVLPAFRFASYWARRPRRAVAGLLQVGDMGYFPDPSPDGQGDAPAREGRPARTRHVRHRRRRTDLADRVFDDDPHCPPGLWFTAGNHEDFDELERLAAQASGRQPDFAVDAYCRVRGIKDGGGAAVRLRAAGRRGLGRGRRRAERPAEPAAARVHLARRRSTGCSRRRRSTCCSSHDAPADAKRVGLRQRAAADADRAGATGVRVLRALPRRRGADRAGLRPDGGVSPGRASSWRPATATPRAAASACWSGRTATAAFEYRSRRLAEDVHPPQLEVAVGGRSCRP